MKILVIHGPNLNLLGKREPDVYGVLTLDDVNKAIQQKADRLGVKVVFYQSNHEGFLIDFIHDQYEHADGIIINPGALTHYSYALRDAIAGVDLPTLEVHLSDIHNRESFRHTSVIKEICIDQISGKGVNSYLIGMEKLVAELNKKMS